MTQPKKLIEVAMPIKEISAESVRDKSIRHGHISTLHLWWARRPLPVCRAVVFASLVPDPLDVNCPEAFKDAVKLLLGRQENNTDPYKPYDDIPYTSAIDKMEDNLRNRLMMFIGKFSDKYVQNEKSGKTTNAKEQLSDASLIKWDNKNDENIIGKARKLIWVAHNAASGKTAKELFADFDKHYKAIQDAEDDLYSTPDRHIHTEAVKAKEVKLHEAIESFLGKMPKVFDPFAGGGAIPLEAARLGCRSYGNDINPVAHVIQQCSLKYPQQFGKPITYSKEEFEKIYGRNELLKWCKINGKHADTEGLKVELLNHLSYDVEFYARKLLVEVEKDIGHLYPANERGIKPIVYYWSRVATCSNPSCRAKIPLLKQFYLSKRRGTSENKWVHFFPKIKGNTIELEIKKGKFEKDGWVKNRKLECPCCGNITDTEELKRQFKRKEIATKLIAVIEEGKEEKLYRAPTKTEIKINDSLESNEHIYEEIIKGDSRNLWVTLWGIDTWGDLFSNRQLTVLMALVKGIKSLSVHTNSGEYNSAIITYLALLVDRIAMRYSTFNTWHIQQDTVEKLFGRQSLPMIFDYPEMNPFTNYTSAALSQLEQIVDYIKSESFEFESKCNNASSGEKEQFPKKSIDAVITDPPYYDAIAYADLSDFFYVWLKRILGDLYPQNFATPLTPKSDECTALKHHHTGSNNNAKLHFENKLLQIFDALEHQTKNIISIMFAHQSTEAWTTLCNSILNAKMNITGSWAVDTESTGGLKEGKAYLESSVTVSCKPSSKIGLGDFKDVKKAIEKTVASEVNFLYRLGFRGADLLTACFGQAVSEFGKYEKVEKADGSEVTVAELLEMARESAFNALLKGFDGDDFTKFYIGWLQLYGFTESEFDDAAKFSRVGLSINVQELFTEHILIKNGNKQTLGGFQERLKEQKNLGEKPNSYLIDHVHKAMALYKGTNRKNLLEYINKVASNPESSFWRVVTSLCEVLPAGSDDHKQALGLLTNKDSLIRESKSVSVPASEQSKLFE